MKKLQVNSWIETVIYARTKNCKFIAWESSESKKIINNFSAGLHSFIHIYSKKPVVSLFIMCLRRVEQVTKQKNDIIMEMYLIDPMEKLKCF